MKAARKVYHQASSKGVSPAEAKRTRKAREAVAKRKYDAGMATLANVEKPKINRLKERIRKTSTRIAELQKQRDKVQRRFR